jgi:hypothetical protein
MGAGKSTFVREHSQPGDLVVDYDAIAGAVYAGMPYSLGGDRHKLVSDIRGRLLRRIRRGEVDAGCAWIISSNPQAEKMFPFHEVMVIDPGRDEVFKRCQSERPEALLGLVDKWYAERGAPAESSIREW